MDLPACERNHHHADSARRRVAACGPRLTIRNRDSTCWRPCSCPPIPEHPTKEQARAALDMLVDLLSEFPFAKVIDRSVALAGLLTAHVRGSLPTAP